MEMCHSASGARNIQTLSLIKMFGMSSCCDSAQRNKKIMSFHSDLHLCTTCRYSWGLNNNPLIYNTRRIFKALKPELWVQSEPDLLDMTMNSQHVESPLCTDYPQTVELRESCVPFTLGELISSSPGMSAHTLLDLIPLLLALFLLLH